MAGDGDLAGRLLEAAKRAGAAAADVLLTREATLQIGVADGALEEVERAEAREAGLRVLIGQRQACVSSSDLSDAALDEMAERAVALAREAPDDPHCGLADPGLIGGHGDPAGLRLLDPTEPPTPEALEQAALAAEAGARSIAGVTQVEQAHAGWSEFHVTLAATNGFSGSYGRSGHSVGASAVAGSGLGRERAYWGESRRHLADLPDPHATGTVAGRHAVEALGPRKPPGGAWPVLYDERCALSLIGHLAAAVNGSAVARGSSWLREAMGERVLPAGIDLTEDPLIVAGAASRPFDAEGIASRSRRLVADGVLESWVLDCATARKLDLATTGNARRGLSAPPSPGVTNLILTEGTRSRDDLIREMGRGLIVTSMIGASINPTTGAYSRGASGFWVEGGEIVHPVNEITIAGNLPEMMRSLVPANDARPDRAFRVPSLLVEGLTIGA